MDMERTGRANKKAVRRVPLVEWGQDHWSLLAYVEACCVDRKGSIDPARMRCNPRRHPGLALPQHDCARRKTYPYPTRLRGGATVAEADDWDCFDDLEAAGLIQNSGSGIQPFATMSQLGQIVAGELRQWKARGGMFAQFQPTVASALVSP